VKNIYDIVLEYIKNKRSVIPSGGGDDKKKPLVDWKLFQTSLPTLEQVKKWQDELNPAVWGMPTGTVSNCFVIDCDSPEAVVIMEKAGLKPHVKTPRGGCHYYCRLPNWPIVNKVGVLPHLDIRGQGGYVNFCGGNGTGSYEVVTQPTDESLIEYTKLPVELQEALRPSLEKHLETVATEGKIPVGERNQKLTSLAGTMRRRGMPETAIQAALLEVNAIQCVEPLSEGEVADIAKSIAAYDPQETPAPEKIKVSTAVKRTSFAKEGDYLYEQIYQDGKPSFIKYNINTGDIQTVDYFIQRDMRIEPWYGEERELEFIKLPSGVIEYPGIRQLLGEIENHIAKYLDIPPDFQKVASYYVLLSWVYDKFTTIPYLRALGDTGTGKSRFLDVCGGLLYKPIIISGCITPAPIFRMINRWQGSLILDEADLKKSDEYNEVLKILNCGFEKGRIVLRADKESADKMHFYSTFGPKIMATRQRFQDVALEARCLTAVMQETNRDNIPPTLTNVFYTEQATLRNKLLLYRLRNYCKIDPDISPRLSMENIEPRTRQICACFSCLFKLPYLNPRP
jgi:hypothetical protein